MDNNEPIVIGRKITEIECLCEGDDYIWAVGSTNGVYVLLALEPENLQTKSVVSIPVAKNGKRNFNQIIEKEGKIFLIPHMNSSLVLYDVKYSRWEFIAISDCPNGNVAGYNIVGAKFSDAFIFNDKLYMMPNRYPAIAAFDCKTNEMLYISDDIEAIIENSGKRDCSVSKKYFSGDDKVIFFCCLNNEILEFDFRDEKLKSVAKLSDALPANMLPAFARDELWLFPQSAEFPIVKIDGNRAVETFDYCKPKEYQSQPYSYSLSVVAEGKIWLVPGMAEQVLVYDAPKRSLEVDANWDVLHGRTVRNGIWKYLFVAKIYNQIMWFDSLIGKLARYDTEKGRIVYNEIVMTDKQQTELEIGYLMQVMSKN